MYFGGQRCNGRRHRGAQQQRLPLARAASQDLLHVGTEADIQHPIGFVQNHAVDVVQRERVAAPDGPDTRPGVPTTMSTPRCNLAIWPRKRRPAVDGDAADALPLASLLDLFFDLNGQFARGHQDQRLGLFAAAHPGRAIPEWE